LYQLNRLHRFSLFFWPSKIHINQLASSLCFPLPGAASPPADITTLLHHVTASASSSSNAWSHRLPSQTETEVLNPHHRYRSCSPDSPTLTLHCYKEVISILTILNTTQPHLHFASSLARAPHHRIAPPTVVVLFHRHPTPIVPPHNDIHGDKLVDPLLLLEQLIDM
jgi:hypothetical protein